MKLEAKRIVKGGREMFQVDIPGSAMGGKRTKVCRSNPSDALIAARTKIEEHRRHGLERSGLTATERDFIFKWRGKLDLEQMDDACEVAYARTQVTVEAATNAYLDAPRESALSPEYRGSLKARLKRFAATFSGRSLSSLTPGDLRDFIQSTGASAPSYYSNLRAVFRYAHMHEWVTRNPMERVPAVDQLPREKDIFTPDGMAKLLRGAWALKEWGLLHYLIFGGLCGLRHTESLRLLPADLGEEIHVRKMKTRKRGIRERWVQVEPVAREWLEWVPKIFRQSRSKTVVGLNDANLRRHRAELAEAAGVAWIDNGLRRSFGSYHLAAYQDAARTAEIMGHTDAETTKAKYRVPRRRDVALEWFALTPDKVVHAESA